MAFHAFRQPALDQADVAFYLYELPDVREAEKPRWDVRDYVRPVSEDEAVLPSFLQRFLRPEASVDPRRFKGVRDEIRIEIRPVEPRRFVGQAGQGGAVRIAYYRYFIVLPFQPVFLGYLGYEKVFDLLPRRQKTAVDVEFVGHPFIRLFPDREEPEVPEPIYPSFVRGYVFRPLEIDV